MNKGKQLVNDDPTGLVDDDLDMQIGAQTEELLQAQIELVSVNRIKVKLEARVTELQSKRNAAKAEQLKRVKKNGKQ